MDVNTTDKDFSVEYATVSGILYVTIDQKLISTQKFDEHVKLHIVFNKDLEEKGIDFDRDILGGKVVDGDGTQDIKLEQEPVMTVTDRSEDADLSEDDNTFSTFAVDPDIGSDTDEMPEVQEEQDDDDYKPATRRKTRRASKMPAPKKKISPRRSELAKRRTNAKRVSNSKESRKTGCLAVRQRKERKSTLKKTKDIKHGMRKKKEANKVVYKIDREQDITCQYCGKLFKTKRQFRYHYRIERKKHHCVKCNKVFLSQAHLMIHMDDHEKEASGLLDEDPNDTRKESLKPKKCCVCGLVRSTLSSLKLHVMTHTGENEFKCCVCGQLSRSNGTLADHMRKHIDVTFGQVTCKVCNITFASRGELAAHRSTHTFPCSLCGKEFPNQTTRNCHYKSFHKHDGLKCHLCDKMYSSKEALDSHIEYHKLQKRTQCPTCGRFYLRLNRHIEQKHGSGGEGNGPVNSNGNIFVCDKCPKQFKTKMSFQEHMLGIHSDKKPYECPECSKRFARRGGLTTHMRLHMQEKPFVCDICGKACNYMGNLRIHMRTHKRTAVDFAQKSVVPVPAHVPALAHVPASVPGPTHIPVPAPTHVPVPAPNAKWQVMPEPVLPVYNNIVMGPHV